MDNLRLILIILGLFILAAIVLLHKPKGQSQPNHARWRQSRREPSLGDAGLMGAADEEAEAKDAGLNTQASFPAFDASRDRPASSQPASPASAAKETTRDTARESARQTTSAAAAPSKPEARKPAASTAPSPDKIISLYIRRRGERRIGGSDLLDAAVKAGLSYGEMNIFHRRHEGADKPVFSMANLTPPGHFDASAWNVFDTPGVALFATLPGPVSALDAWDSMLASGSRIAELLEADLLDDSKCLLTRQRIAQLREEMREYDRVHGLNGY